MVKEASTQTIKTALDQHQSVCPGSFELSGFILLLMALNPYSDHSYCAMTHCSDKTVSGPKGTVCEVSVFLRFYFALGVPKLLCCTAFF